MQLTVAKKKGLLRQANARFRQNGFVFSRWEADTIFDNYVVGISQAVLYPIVV